MTKEKLSPLSRIRAHNRQMLDSVFDRRLLLYAIAAGSALAFVPSAHSEIIYTPDDTALKGTHDELAIDLDHDGSADYMIILRQCWSSSHYGFVGCLSARGAGQQHAVEVGNSNYAPALRENARIGPNHPFNGTAFMGTPFGYRGDWTNTRNRYLGVKFLINGEVHFGWIGFRYVVQSWHQFARARLSGWAYETQPSQPILAGDTGGGTSTQTTSLQNLAAGHTGIAQRRKRTPGAH